MNSFGPQKNQISSTGKKVPFWQIFRMGWDGHALLQGIITKEYQKRSKNSVFA
jgi:hypothetical protein